eukprot:gene5894-8133_t
MSWYYITAGLSLWSIDYTIRMWSVISTKAELSSLQVVLDNNNSTAKGGVVQLSYHVNYLINYNNEISSNQKSGLNHLPGQYVFINIPMISEHAWHPFTISSIPINGQSVTSHHIKSMGESQWTGQLYSLAKRIESDKSITTNSIDINIEGPYGKPVNYNNYEHIILIAGGIGITPIGAIYKYLYELMIYDLTNPSKKKELHNIMSVHLIWTVRSMKEANIFLAEFNAIASNELTKIFSFHLYLSKESASSMAITANNNIHYGRPNFEKHFSSIIHSNNATPHTVLSFVCGPKPLIEQIDKLSQFYGIDFKSETFEF